MKDGPKPLRGLLHFECIIHVEVNGDMILGGMGKTNI